MQAVPTGFPEPLYEELEKFQRTCIRIWLTLVTLVVLNLLKSGGSHSEWISRNPPDCDRFKE